MFTKSSGLVSSHASHTVVLMSNQDVWNRNVEQHHTFKDAIAITALYLRQCYQNLPTPVVSPIPKPSITTTSLRELQKPPLLSSNYFDPAQLRAHVDTWLPTLVEHLAEEMETLKSELLEKVGERGVKEATTAFMLYHRQWDPKWHLCDIVGETFPGSVRSSLIFLFFSLP